MCAYTACVVVASGATAQAEPKLPDLIAWDSQPKCYMYCGFLDSSFVPGKVVYRFIGALPNVGAGPLEVREVTHPDAIQDVYQRIYDTEGGMTEVLIGSFPNAAPISPRHLWLPGIAQYKLRTVTVGGGVGEILSTNDKTSMAVVDSTAYNKNLPGAPPIAFYNNVSAQILGISIGYADVYGVGFEGQWADATGLPSGTYWLEVTVNPYGDIAEGRVVESDYANNSTRILVDLLPGDYNDDGTVNAADYTIWRNTLGQSVAVDTTGADGNGDGTIGQSDYAIWKTNFGKTIAGAGTGGASAIPEPAGVMLAVVALAACGLAARGRRRIACIQLPTCPRPTNRTTARP